MINVTRIYVIWSICSRKKIGIFVNDWSKQTTFSNFSNTLNFKTRWGQGGQHTVQAHVRTRGAKSQLLLLANISEDSNFSGNHLICSLRGTLNHPIWHFGWEGAGNPSSSSGFLSQFLGIHFNTIIPISHKLFPHMCLCVYQLYWSQNYNVIN